MCELVHHHQVFVPSWLKLNGVLKSHDHIGTSAKGHMIFAKNNQKLILFIFSCKQGRGFSPVIENQG